MIQTMCVVTLMVLPGKPLQYVLRWCRLLRFSKTHNLWSLKAAFTITFFAAVNHHYDHKQRTLKRWLSRWREFTPVPSHGSIFVYVLQPQNVMPAPVTQAWVHPGCCPGARISLRFEISQRHHVSAKRPPVCEIRLPVDWNGWRMRNVCNFESNVSFINMKCTFQITETWNNPR